jgi:hypothetical protein
MRKGFFLIFLLIASLSFAQITIIPIIDVWTSDGLFWVSCYYDGQNRGQIIANCYGADPNVGGGGRSRTPVRAHIECRDFILRSLQPSKGQTYVIAISRPWYGNDINELKDWRNYWFVIEYTSATQYNFWFIRD